MTERKPTTVVDPGVWLGSQLEHPAESAGLTPPADDANATNRPSAGAAYLVAMVAIGAVGVALLALWVAGGGR